MQPDPKVSHSIPILDSHQHFWIYHNDTHQWINDEMKMLRRNFLPQDLQSLLVDADVIGTIAVQADQSELETEFLLQLAKEFPYIKAVVGWVDLMHPNLEQQLLNYKRHRLLKGFRHILQSESPEFMLQPAFMNGLRLLQEYGYTYDLLVYPYHLTAAIQLVKELPELRIVIDHLAKPDIRNQVTKGWRQDIEAIANFPQVYCKLSGMVTEANWNHWRYEDFIPYLNHIHACFGTSRIMVGSDWPVCLTAASYADCLNIVRKYFEQFSEEERRAIFTENAVRFYGIDTDI